MTVTRPTPPRLLSLRFTATLCFFLVAQANAADVKAADTVANKPPEAAIASANKLATAAGLEILKRGGNAFDAAVAVSAALGVVEPESSGLGGGAFGLLYFADRKGSAQSVFIDARETAPMAATRDMYLDAKGEPNRELSVNGPLAAAIPGMPAALAHVQSKYGRLDLTQTMAPAIRLAEKGFAWGDKNFAMQSFRVETLKKSPVAARLFLREGNAIAKGTLFKQPELAKTLRMIASSGGKDFYHGAFAENMVAGVRAAGGIWQLSDLESYQVKERVPLSFHYRDYQFITAPPPSSGGTALASILNILSGFDLAKHSHVERVHLLVESMRRAYRDRAIYLGDPDFTAVPVALLMSKDYAAGLRAGINPERATPSDLLPGITMAAQGTDTTHFSIIDRDGNMVAWTQTVNLPFGNAFVAPGTGFLLNNEMDDFSVKPGVPNAFGLVGDDANAIAPGKRPLSSMTPTLVFGPNRIAALGSPGGSRIITMVLLSALALIDGASAADAAALPRFHHQYLPDAISAEPGALTPEEIAALQKRGFTVSPNERTWGNMQIVLWDKKANAVSTGSDPRWKTVGGGGIYR
jgi:gamma-glutamyltranspeptidase / glutathione hydrolase